ncbi:hypothetical protein BH11CYA1_BH11CYA1_05050 [soil metagenome]
MKPSILQRSFWQEIWDTVSSWLLGPEARPVVIPIKIDEQNHPRR